MMYDSINIDKKDNESKLQNEITKRNSRDSSVMIEDHFIQVFDEN